MKKRITKILSLLLAVNMMFCSAKVVSAQDASDIEAGDTIVQYPDTSASGEGLGIRAAAARADYGATASKRYTITGLRHGEAIQKTYIGSTYVYVLQRSGKDMFMSRCTISGASAVYKDEMKLTNFGHSQTLEAFDYGNTSYFWIACKASTDTTHYWSTQVGRLEYKPGTTVDYTAIKRLSALGKANKTGQFNGTVKRADAALSSDKSILLIWSKNTDNVMQFAFYNAAKVNAALSSSSSKYVNCDAADIRLACISSFTMKNTFLINGSCQGLEVSDAKSIYMASGGVGDTKWIFKLNSTGSVIGKAYIKNTDLSGQTNTEIEGLQLKGDDVYFGLCNHNEKGSRRQYIYSVPKGAF